MESENDTLRTLCQLRKHLRSILLGDARGIGPLHLNLTKFSAISRARVQFRHVDSSKNHRRAEYNLETNLSHLWILAENIVYGAMNHAPKIL